MFVLEKNPDRPFRVLNLTDPQLYNDDWAEGAYGSRLLRYTVDELVGRTSPDLITVSGDMALVGQDEAYVRFAQMMESYAIPWCFVYGNHDDEWGVDYCAKTADAMLAASPHCFFEAGDPKLGCGNYVIKIEEAGRPVYALLMFDSHNRPEGTTDDSDWAHLYPEQVDWYREQIAALGGLKNAMIMHIPPYGYRTVFDAAWNTKYKYQDAPVCGCTDPKYWKPGFEGAYGVRHERICSTNQEDHVLDAMLECGTTDLILVGHDHINNFVIPYKGIRFAYALKTGCGCYWESALSGGTLLTVTDRGCDLEHVYVDPAGCN